MNRTVWKNVVSFFVLNLVIHIFGL